ncbi:MAG: MBL fold metallo-hydrolase [Clostridia bacterium]|nr:MBL fold metallo-hydrolase [Clostridia bacterium]
MKLTVLGSCSGTEAMPGRRHASIALELDGRLYLLDAGDSCGYTAHLLGIDVTKLEAVFISHPHIDHIGGLPYLFFLIQKLLGRRGESLERPIDVFVSAPEAVAGARLMLQYSAKPLMDSLVTHSVRDGVVYDSGALRVTARHNGHMGETRPPYHSFSFLLEAERRKILYSGDVKDISELEGWFDCDLLMMETGHHDPVAVAGYLRELAVRPERVLFVHHGRKVLADPEGCLKQVRAILGGAADIAWDGMAIEL